MALNTEIRGLVELQRKSEQVVRDLHGDPMLNAMRRATLLVQTDAKRLVPVDTGRLRSNITPDIRAEGNEVNGVVGSNVLHALYVETGTRPHWPPVSALQVWARRHGTTAYAVARGISRHGTKGVHYLQRAVQQNEGRIQGLIGDGVARIVEQ